MRIENEVAYMTQAEYDALPLKDPEPKQETQFSMWLGESAFRELYRKRGLDLLFLYRRDYPPLPCRAQGCNCFVGGPSVCVRPIVIEE